MLIKDNSKKARLKRKLAAAELKLSHIQSLIDKGRLGWPTYTRLNIICRKIVKLDIALRKN